MLINIEKIQVNDRIRQDFGDVQSLADNIKKEWTNPADCDYFKI